MDNRKPSPDEPVPLIGDGVDVSTFVLHTPMEIGYVLRALEQKKDMMTIYFDRGHHSYLSAVVGVDPKQEVFWFDVSGVETLNRALLGTDRMVFAAAPEGIKVQFVIDGGVELVEYDGAPAFEAPFPQDLVKLQRREFFRLETPVGKPITCRLPHPNGQMLTLPLHDISIGGVGLWVAGHLDVHQLDVFKGCKLDLGTFGLLDVTLEVRSVRKVLKRDRTVQTMLGMRFIDLPRQTENVLQRYIAQLERDRHQLLRS